jgi:murein DD-endopeptidase MepM/ murein hydrolase activator NlpD
MGAVRVSPRAVRRLPWLLVALALLVGVGGVLTAQSQTVSARPAPRAAATASALPEPTPERTVTPSPAPVRVAPLRARIPAQLLVVSSTPLTTRQIHDVVRATGAKASLLVSAGTVSLGTGRTKALGVDPGTFRPWTPKGTAESNPLWQSVAAGDGSVAHTVARAFEVPLGGTITASAIRLRVGSFATTGLPGVGLVVDQARAAQLHLVPRSGLLLSVPQRDPEQSARLARDVSGRGTTVGAVAYSRRGGSWGIPVVGRVSSPFGYRMHPIKHVVLFHDGIDVAAPYGAPVYAMSDGAVLYAGPASGFGQEIVLTHRDGVTTVYGHVSRILVASGPVKVGQAIALVGNEGESTGPHLHAEVRVDDRPVDPIAWLRAHGVKI